MENHDALSTALERINSGEFEFEWEAWLPSRGKSELQKLKAREAAARNHAKGAEMNQKVREMLAELYGVVNHPKEPKLWQKAWDDGHASGYSEIASQYDDLVQLVR